MNFGMPPGWALDPDCQKAAVPADVWCRGRWRVHRRMGKQSHTWGATYRCDDGVSGTLMTGGREAWWRGAAAACEAADFREGWIMFEIRVGREVRTIVNKPKG